MKLRYAQTQLLAAAVSVAALAAVTGVIFAVKPFAPVLSLGVLYVFAVLPVAVLFGLGWAVVVSIGSMLAFNWFFLPPLHTLALRESESWVSLAVYLVTAFVVSAFAARSRRRAVDAEQRRGEAALLADVSSVLLEADHVQDAVPQVATLTGGVIGANHVRIELGSVRRPERGERAYPLAAGGRDVGRLFVAAEARLSPSVLERVLPALASLFAVALERERLRWQAVEAETLRRSDAVKTALLRAVSHDLRSPLTAIRTAAEGLHDTSLSLPPEDRAALEAAILGEAQRLDRLVENLLDLSRLEVGAAEPRPEIWTMDGLLARALEAVGSGAERVSALVPPDVRPVRVDGAHAERILVNLLENALAYSPADEPVRVVVEDSGVEIVTRVIDRGAGIAPTELERLFEPFEHGGAGAARGGSGLGLAIASGFAQVNGGRVFAEPAPEGGTVFALALPAVPAPVGMRA
jgi:two-component system, OmpR family, sensor histidine kinase KdpD